MARYWKRVTLSGAFRLVGLTALALFMLLPIVYMFNQAFKPFSELFLYPPTFFVEQPTLQNFKSLFFAASGDVVPFTRYLFNSVLVSSITIVGVVLISAMAGYVLAKHQFHFKTLITALIMISLMFAAETVQIPRYLLISGAGLNDTYFAHILPFLASPVGVFLARSFIGQIPDALLEAARLDGANEWTIFVRVILPLAMPALATVLILTFQGVWMDVEASTLFVQKETMKTLAYYVTTLTNAVGNSNSVAGQGMMAAASLLIFLPNLLMFLVFQRRIIETMVSSGIK